MAAAAALPRCAAGAAGSRSLLPALPRPRLTVTQGSSWRGCRGVALQRGGARPAPLSPTWLARGGGGAGGAGGTGGTGGGGGSGGGGDAGHPMRLWTLLYAALLAAGGVMGYVKKGSTKSLSSACGAALILALSARSMVGAQARASVAVCLAVALLLSVVMVNRYTRTRKLMPAGLTAGASLAMSAAYLGSLFARSNMVLRPPAPPLPPVARQKRQKRSCCCGPGPAPPRASAAAADSSAILAASRASNGVTVVASGRVSLNLLHVLATPTGRPSANMKRCWSGARAPPLRPASAADAGVRSPPGVSAAAPAAQGAAGGALPLAGRARCSSGGGESTAGLPAPDAGDGAASTSGRPAEERSAPGAGAGVRYCCYFLHRLLDFRLPELHALADLAGVPAPLAVEPPAAGADSVSPFWYVTLPGDDAARRIVERAVLIRAMLELWGEGGSFEELADAIAAHPAAAKAPYLGRGVTFRVLLDAWGFTWTPEQQARLFAGLERVLPFEGRVDLAAPAHVFWLCCIGGGAAHNGLPAVPERWYFGRQVAVADRSWVQSYALNKRAYIGPTSMDTELAFLMANMAQVRRGQLVCDPYVGTASVLLAAAARGAHTLGCDIDVRVIKLGKPAPGRGGGRVDVWSNFDQYGLPRPVGLVRLDVHRHPFRAGLTEVFDAILGDPPYGVRAGGRKSCAREVEVRHPATHIPSTAPYTLTECLTDLLELAAQTLVVGGRLVFFMPATPETYREDELPAHPSLRLVANSEQLLTTRYSRRLVTMAKDAPYDAHMAAAWAASRAGFTMAIDAVRDAVYAALPRPGDAPGGDGADALAGGGAAKPKFRGKMC
ncbi:Tr1 [Scenedesmus sp. PABB004]|nr:Tr1 [Scenedesmus sp. PABB004]